MDIIAAYGLAGSYRGAAEMCGTTHRTVKKVVTEELARMSGQSLPARKARVSNTQVVRDLVGQKVTAPRKEDLREAAAAGREGGGLRGVGSQLPAPGRRREAPVAQ